jgi:putative heme-binding domain-containing protein
LPITDAIIHPGDGAMYVTIGGRKVQSGLYRVTYVGDESTELVDALLALARVTGACPQHRNDSTPPVDTAMRDKLLAAVVAIDASKLDATSQRTLQRTTQIILNRFGRPDDATVQKLIVSIDPLFPSESAELNWLLCETLAYLQSPTVAAKAMALIGSTPTQEEQVQNARSNRLLKSGWTDELHTRYFEWFLKAASYRGGASFEKFIQFIRDDAVAALSESQKESLKEILAKKSVKKSALENLGAIFAGRSETKWTLDELSQTARANLKQRDFANGRKMFAAAGCYACHRFDNQGGMTGPDLTTSGRRYSAHDLLDQVINPSKVINEQFSAVSVITEDGLMHTGVVVNLNGDRLTLNTDLTDPNKRVNINRNTIEELIVSKTSPMPVGLFNRMTKDEILDLIAFLISGGDSDHEYFRD